MATKTTENKTIERAIARGDFKHQYLIYSRKSTDEADSQKNSISYQHKENRRYAQREDLPVADVTLAGFCKGGVITEKHSGFKESGQLNISKDGIVQFEIERPKFHQLMRFLSQRKFKGVICLCWDRASRNEGDNTVLRKLKRIGVDFHYVYATYDDSSSGELHMDIDGMFAQHHSRVTSEKIRLATRTNREDGKCTYRAPIGYLNEGNVNHKPLDPERAPLLRELFQLYATGDWSLPDLSRHAVKIGLRSRPQRRPRTKEELLADDDEDDNLHPKITRPLRVNHLGKILRNPFYIGQVIGPDGSHIPSTSHEPLIDLETFQQVQTLLSGKRTSIHYTDKLDHPFRGFVRCAQCRRVYTPYEKKGILYFNARCAPTCTNTLKNCNLAHITNQVRKLLSRLTFTADELEELDASANTQLVLLTEKIRQREIQHEREQARIRESLQYLRGHQLELLKAGTYTPTELTQERARLEAELDEMTQADEISEAATRALLDDIEKVSELAHMALCLFDLANPAEKERFAKTIVSELFIDQETLNYSPQSGFDRLLARNTSVGEPKNWFSELRSDSLRWAISTMNDLTLRTRAKLT